MILLKISSIVLLFTIIYLFIYLFITTTNNKLLSCGGLPQPPALAPGIHSDVYLVDFHIVWCYWQ